MFSLLVVRASLRSLNVSRQSYEGKRSNDLFHRLNVLRGYRSNITSERTGAIRANCFGCVESRMQGATNCFDKGKAILTYSAALERI